MDILKPWSNGPTLHLTFTEHPCSVKCWIVWPPCSVTQYYVQRCWVKFARDQKQSNISIVFKCSLKCWIVWLPQHWTLCRMLGEVLDRLTTPALNIVNYNIKCCVECWIVCPGLYRGQQQGIHWCSCIESILCTGAHYRALEVSVNRTVIPDSCSRRLSFDLTTSK